VCAGRKEYPYFDFGMFGYHLQYIPLDMPIRITADVITDFKNTLNPKPRKEQTKQILEDYTRRSFGGISQEDMELIEAYINNKP